MSLRFRRSIKLLPGVKINLGKTGASLSFGPRGASVTVGGRGVYTNVGIPGTGLSFRTKAIGSGKINSQHKRIPFSQKPFPDPIPQKIQFILKEDGSIEVKDEWGNPASPKLMKIAREQGADKLQEWLAKQCEKINEGIDLIFNFHIDTPSPNNEIIFKREQFHKDIPIEIDFNEPKPKEPRLKKIGLFGRIFSCWRKRIEIKNSLALQCYDRELNDWRNRGILAREQYEHDLNEWKREKEIFDAEQDKLKDMVERGIYEDLEIMRDFLNSSLSEIPWPRETEISLEILEDGRKIILDVDLPEIEMLPKRKASIAGRGLRLSIKEKSETERRKEYMRHVHAIGFRITGTVFASLPKVEIVVLSAYSQRVNSSTGGVGDEYLYSVRINKSKWSKINFQNLSGIDPVSCLEEFDLKRRMTQTGIFKSIDPYTN
ncbi:DUF4236 domain-containing protein [Desulfobacca acetoxidans]